MLGTAPLTPLTPQTPFPSPSCSPTPGASTPDTLASLSSPMLMGSPTVAPGSAARAIAGQQYTHAQHYQQQYQQQQYQLQQQAADVGFGQPMLHGTSKLIKRMEALMRDDCEVREREALGRSGEG